jgi:hypothetical protein
MKTFLGVHYPPVGKRDGLGLFLDAGAAGVVTFQCGWPAKPGQFYATRFQANGEDNPPNFYTAPLQASRDHFYGQQSKWMQNPGAMARLANNELDIETPWHGQQQVIFYLEFMRLCELAGEKAGICNYAGGNPSDNAPYTFEERWRSVLPAIKYAGQHGHFVVLHIHQQDKGPMESPGGQSISLRHRRSIEYWLNSSLHPECVITEPPRIIFNEVSNGVGGVEPDENSYFNSVTWLDQVCRTDPYNSLYTALCLYQAGADEPITKTMYARLADYVASQPEIIINPLPVDPPPPDPIQESYNGATVGANASITDFNGDEWRLDTTAPRNPYAGYPVLYNGAQYHGGLAEMIMYADREVLVINAQFQVWRALPRAPWWMRVFCDSVKVDAT